MLQNIYYLIDHSFKTKSETFNTLENIRYVPSDCEGLCLGIDIPVNHSNNLSFLQCQNVEIKFKSLNEVLIQPGFLKYTTFLMFSVQRFM